MPTSSSPALRQLQRLSKSSPDFPNQLCDVLYGEEYMRCAQNLQGDDLACLVEYLDKALDGLDPSCAAARKCLRELRSICGNKAILPTSYTLSSHLLNIGPDPFASGGFGDVYHGTLDGSRVCVKRVRMYIQDGPQKAATTFCQEAVMWKRLAHPNIVPLLGITISPLQLISNWMSGGDLPKYIERHSNADRLELLSDVAKGLFYLHSCNVIHGDLKGPNVLVDDSGHARIADFGLATVTQNLESMRSASRQHGLSARWAAPEILNEQGVHSKEADTFSFAMVMVEVFTCAVPFSSRSSLTAMLAIMQGERPPRPTHPTFTDKLWILMQRCWDHDHRLRPEVSEILQVLLTFEHTACKRLIRRAFAPHELPSLFEAIFSSKDEIEAIRCLRGDDAQSLIDVIDEALESPDFSPWIRRKCLKVLYKACGRNAILPNSLRIPLCYDRTGIALYRGGFSDVWKGKHCGRDVAVKVMRTFSNIDLQKIIGRFCKEVVTWKALRHPNVMPLIGVTMSETQFAVVTDWMANGNINDFVKVHPDANRLELLGGVAKGLIYIHSQEVIHGDLKGANIMIDETGNARLADFGLLTIISDPANFFSSSSYTQGGIARWMSPELISPDRFGFTNDRPTKSSDCYALGMVIYETISGHLPFHGHTELFVAVKIVEGERPPREPGFSNRLWEMLERCWMSQPNARPSIEDVLQCLESVSQSLELPPPGVDVGMEHDSDWDLGSDSPVYIGLVYTSGTPDLSDSLTPESFSSNESMDRDDWY